MTTDELLQIDREDLITVLEMRFGTLSPEIREEIDAIEDGNVLQRLILVAANVPDWSSLLTELHNLQGAFRIVGDGFNPIPSPLKGIQ